MMNIKPVIAAIVTITNILTAIADVGKANFTVAVINEETGVPIADVPVTGVFINHHIRWDNASEEIIQNSKTGKDGTCRFSGETNCGNAVVRVRNYSGYYDSEILKIPYTNADCTVSRPIWEPDNVVVTLVLQRVVRPIPLFVKTARLKVEPDKIIENQAKFAYDILAGAWLPPYGSGKNADVEFSCLPRERLPDGNNVMGGTTHRYKNAIQVFFPGADNGICRMPSTLQTLKVRNAPLDGYGHGLSIWKQLSLDLQRDEGVDSTRNFCFRIRTRRNDDGKIVEAYYGKIYGDIELRQKYDGDEPSIVGVKFLYYFNPTPLNRNLEYKRYANLCPAKHKPIDGLLKP